MMKNVVRNMILAVALCFGMSFSSFAADATASDATSAIVAESFDTTGKVAEDEGMFDFDMPDTPDVPETPDVPVIPDVPETPDVPVIPDVPETPDVPVVPADSSTTEIRSNGGSPEKAIIIRDEEPVPEEAETPDIPEIPDVPATPDVPVDSSVPSLPKTGDDDVVAMAGLICLASLAGLVAILLRKGTEEASEARNEEEFDIDKCIRDALIDAEKEHEAALDPELSSKLWEKLRKKLSQRTVGQAIANAVDPHWATVNDHL